MTKEGSFIDNDAEGRTAFGEELELAFFGGFLHEGLAGDTSLLY